MIKYILFNIKSKLTVATLGKMNAHHFDQSQHQTDYHHLNLLVKNIVTKKLDEIITGYLSLRATWCARDGI